MTEVKNISYSYSNIEAVKNVSFSVQSGECVGILGNNGSGKSTLITCINKIRTPSTGTVLINDRDTRKMTRPEIARNISYVAQKNEMDHVTVFDSVLLGRKPYIKWAISQNDIDICDEIIEQIGLSDFKLRYINELSGGELQKVMLARALVQQPKLMLLDEPTSNLDPKNQYEMMALIKELTVKRNISSIIVLHDINLALRYCTRFLFLKSGEVYSYGDESIITPQAIYDVYGIDTIIEVFNKRKIVIIQ